MKVGIVEPDIAHCCLCEWQLEERRSNNLLHDMSLHLRTEHERLLLSVETKESEVQVGPQEMQTVKRHILHGNRKNPLAWWTR